MVMSRLAEQHRKYFIDHKDYLEKVYQEGGKSDERLALESKFRHKTSPDQYDTPGDNDAKRDLKRQYDAITDEKQRILFLLIHCESDEYNYYRDYLDEVAAVKSQNEDAESQLEDKVKHRTSAIEKYEKDSTKAYLRLVQPKVPNALPKDSSYFRLGHFVVETHDKEPKEVKPEIDLVTGLKTTFSKVEWTLPGVAQNAEDAKANEKLDPKKKYDSTSQQSDKFTITKSDEIASNNHGILMYTDQDLNAKVAGAALMKFGSGHVTEVTNADAAYKVKNGAYDIAAKNGVFIKAGIHEDAANGIESFGANIEITAEGYIKQTAYGNLDDVTYGDSKKEVHGNSSDRFFGTKTDYFDGDKISEFHGTETVTKYSTSTTMTLSDEKSYRLSARFSATAAADMNIYGGFKTDVVLGLETKLVLAYLKFTGTLDFKYAKFDAKVVQFKVEKTDLSVVGQFAHVISKVFGVETAAVAKKNEGVAAKDAALKNDAAALKANMNGMDAHIVNLQVTT